MWLLRVFTVFWLRYYWINTRIYYSLEIYNNPMVCGKTWKWKNISIILTFSLFFKLVNYIISMSSMHIIKQIWHLGECNINFYCTLKNDIALGASASCNIIFQSAIKIDIALTQVPYLYNIVTPFRCILRNAYFLAALHDWFIFFLSIIVILHICILWIIFIIYLFIIIFYSI